MIAGLFLAAAVQAAPAPVPVTQPIRASKIILVGDSTTAVAGVWGGAFCADHVTSFAACVNLARGRRSTSNYRAEGAWDLALAQQPPPADGTAPPASEMQETPFAQRKLAFDRTHLGTRGAGVFATMVAKEPAAAVPDMRKLLFEEAPGGIGPVAALAATPAVTASGGQLAFPGAEGAGRFARGGRGGRVMIVTTLADSGAGSLREAVEAKGPRTIVFATDGTIALTKPLRVREGQVTIAGQSAPGGGITLRDHPLEVQADDVVIRYIRSRLGDASKSESDAVWVLGGRRIILDHVSASWSVDETLSASARYAKGEGFWDLTVQWSIIADSLTHSLHAKGEHGYGSLIRGGRGSRISFHHNLWANHEARMPRPGNYDGPDVDPQGAFLDFRSNVFYNWGGSHSGYNADKATLARYNFVDNTYIAGPDSDKPIAFQESNMLAKAYFAGNSMNGAIPADPWSLVVGVQPEGYRLAVPVDVAPVRSDPAASAYARVLAGAGASKARDAVDAKVVAGVRTRTGRQIDTQGEDGGWPVLARGVVAPDRDHDGMPDAWERAHGLDPAKDDSARVMADGYTAVEGYLNGLGDK